MLVEQLLSGSSNRLLLGPSRRSPPLLLEPAALSAQRMPQAGSGTAAITFSSYATGCRHLDARDRRIFSAGFIDDVVQFPIVAVKVYEPAQRLSLLWRMRSWVKRERWPSLSKVHLRPPVSLQRILSAVARRQA